VDQDKQISMADIIFSSSKPLALNGATAFATSKQPKVTEMKLIDIEKKQVVGAVNLGLNFKKALILDQTRLLFYRGDLGKMCLFNCENRQSKTVLRNKAVPAKLYQIQCATSDPSRAIVAVAEKNIHNVQATIRVA